MNTFDPETRELCPDGTCIGLIGPDGQCRECGIMGPVPYRDRTHAAADDPGKDDAIEATGDADAEPEPAAATAADLEAETDDDDIETRALCPDDLCIGVLDAQGRCKECGRAA